MRLLSTVVAVLSLALSACGGGGGSGGSGFEEGPADWGVPFVPASASRTMTLCLRNLESDATTATVTVHAGDGSIVTGGPIALDGDDQETFFVPTAAGGWVHVATPSRRVEVEFRVDDDGAVASEASRGWPLGDLAAPPPSTSARATILPETDLVQVVNASGAVTLVTATAWVPGASASSPWVAVPLAPIPLDAFAAATLSPAALTGTPGFFGAVELTAPTPLFVATEEGPLAFDGAPHVVARDRDGMVVVEHGPVTASPASWTDFAVLLRNDADDARTVVLADVRAADGTQILLAPRTIELVARETLTLGTMDAPFDDLFGDVLSALSLTRATLRFQVPEDVEVSLRQFDPVSLVHVATLRPAPAAHVADALHVDPQPTLPSLVRTWVHVVNPGSSTITVAVSAVVPQPDGFDAAITPIVSLEIPAHQTARWSPDGLSFVDRDLASVPVIGVRLTSPAPFHVSGWGEETTSLGLRLLLRPVIVRSHDDAD